VGGESGTFRLWMLSVNDSDKLADDLILFRLRVVAGCVRGNLQREIPITHSEHCPWGHVIWTVLARADRFTTQITEW